MISESGRIVSVEQDGLWVETVRASTCGSCGARQGCGHGILNSIAAGRRSYTWVLLENRSADSFAVGDVVEIALPEQVIVSGSFVVYMLPILLTLIGAVATNSIFARTLGADGSALLGALIGFMGGIQAVRWHARLNRHNPSLQPVLINTATDPVRLV